MVSKRTLSEDGVFAPYTGPKVVMDNEYIPGSQQPDKETVATVAAAAKSLVDANSKKVDDVSIEAKEYSEEELVAMSIPELRAIHKKFSLPKPENQKKETFLKMVLLAHGITPPTDASGSEDSGL